ncbi:flavin reductase family protein [Streptomyces sp. NPDC006193]|uniref:flavin reductase family protein n=1 Tax=Streptomyces sp. NPDC006193 TaxID=3155717 RepID=UPI0033A478D2
MHRTIDPRVLYFGTPVVLLGTANDDGSANLAPMSSVWWVGRSCMLGLDETSRTTENLTRTGECVLNLPSSALVAAVDRLALLTGSPVVPEHKRRKGYRYEPDKFGAAGLTPLPAETVGAPRVAECPVHLEAVVDRVHAFAEEDSGVVAVDARIVRVHVEEDLLVPGSRRYIDADRWDPLIMKFCEFYGGGPNLHPSALARGWEMPARRAAETATRGEPPHVRC